MNKQKRLLFELILRQSKGKNNEGFSLFEVLVAILVSSAFLMGTLQAMTINAVLQVKAEREAQANFWIQEDLDTVYAAASAMDDDHTNICDSSTSPTASNRFGAALISDLNSVSSSGPSNFLQYKMDSKGNHEFDTNGKPTFLTVEDSGNSSITKQATVQVASEKQLVNKSYRLVRVITLDSTTNYDVLQIYYRVGEPHEAGTTQDNDGDQLVDDERGKTSIIAENYSEVIPAAVSECTS